MLLMLVPAVVPTAAAFADSEPNPSNVPVNKTAMSLVRLTIFMTLSSLKGLSGLMIRWPGESVAPNLAGRVAGNPGLAPASCETSTLFQGVHTYLPAGNVVSGGQNFAYV